MARKHPRLNQWEHHVDAVSFPAHSFANRESWLPWQYRSSFLCVTLCYGKLYDPFSSGPQYAALLRLDCPRIFFFMKRGLFLWCFLEVLEFLEKTPQIFPDLDSAGKCSPLCRISSA